MSETLLFRVPEESGGSDCIQWSLMFDRPDLLNLFQLNLEADVRIAAAQLGRHPNLKRPVWWFAVEYVARSGTR